MKKLLFALFLFLFCLFLGEQYFKNKIKPGYQTHYSGFEVVDSLFVYDDYHTDAFGNYVLSPLVSDSLRLAYNQENCEFEDKEIFNRIASVDGIKKILNDFCALKLKHQADYPFEKYYQKLRTQSDLTKSDSAILAYASFPFNHHGFRSISLENYQSDKLKVMFIGDSFVWGMSADPYYNSFVDILISRDYQVFNLGITSVDPIQYYSICKNYFDTIQPDLVIINFYEGNDFLNHKRKHAQGIPHEYITNAGFFESNPAGNFLPVSEAYEYYVNALSIPNNTVFNRLLGKTAMGSLIWTLTHPNERYQYSTSLTTDESIAYTKLYIDSISNFLSDKGANYFYTITPEELAKHNKDLNTLICDTEKIDRLFNGLEYYLPPNLKHEDYNEPKDFHFNNVGSLKFANFIDSLIQTKLNLE